MRLVIDANIAFSLLKKDSFTRRLAQEHSLELYSHKSILDKFERIKEILSRLVNLKVKVSPQQLNRAAPLISDQEDKQYLALAFRLNCPIWSNDLHFKEPPVTKVIKVFKTEELSEFLSEYSSHT